MSSDNVASEVARLRGRLSALNDKILVLEDSLKKTQQMMESDMKKVVNLVTASDRRG
tara:strand:- start:836 stop:1006 length:171 start_codon:yes stop_codon:yes gene_type:complete